MKIVLGIVALLVAAFLIIGLVAPKEMTLEREIVINKPQAEVYEFMRFAKNQDAWSPWLKMDPAMKTSTTGTDGEVGFIYAWDGNKDVGVGEQEIKALTPNERIDTELRFKEPMEGTADAWFLTEAVGANQTKVTWGFHSISKFPFNAICFIMNKMTNMMEKTFDQGLADLKTVLESTPSPVVAPVVPDVAPAIETAPAPETVAP